MVKKARISKEPAVQPGLAAIPLEETPEDRAIREGRMASDTDGEGNPVLEGEDIAARIAEEHAQAAKEKADRLDGLVKRYPDKVRTMARKIAEQRGADPDAPISTAAGEFEWAWAAYADQAAELADLAG